MSFHFIALFGEKMPKKLETMGMDLFSELDRCGRLELLTYQIHKEL